MLSGEMFDNVIVGVDDYDAARDAVGLATQLASGMRRPATRLRSWRDTGDRWTC